ncbi:hypothetical protein AVEN_86608-1, partial [Araneus ventricosus]
WEERKLEDGIKWKILEHQGPVFTPPYERVPNNEKVYYNVPEGFEKVRNIRRLKANIFNIKKLCKKDLSSKDMQVRQRAVVLYFIDKLALSVGTEKDEGTAETVGCCSLRVENMRMAGIQCPYSVYGKSFDRLESRH